MTSTLKGCTYNIGYSYLDHLKLRRAKDPDFSGKIQSKEEEIELLSLYEKVERKSAELILQAQLDFLCIQEGGNESRPFFQTFTDQKKAEDGTEKYTIIHTGNKTDCFDSALILNTNRFQNIQDHSFIAKAKNKYTNDPVIKDVSVATVMDKETGQKIAIVSTHVPGLDLTMTPLSLEEEENGNALCRVMIDKLDEVGKDRLQIIGADMNANPEFVSDRFSLFYQKGFTLLRSHLPTNVNPDPSISTGRLLVEREIDFFLIRNKKCEEKITFTCMEPILEFDPSTNCSDHILLLMETSSKVSHETVDLLQVKSSSSKGGILSRLFSWLNIS